MKKRLLYILLLTTLLAVLLAIQVLASNTHADHCVCGGQVNNGDHTGHQEICWTAWTGSTRLPSGDGSYYLTTDVTLTGIWGINAWTKMNLCLNGHVVRLQLQDSQATASVIQIDIGGELALCDCNGTAQSHKFTENGDGLWVLDEENGTRTVTGGVITGGTNGGVEIGGGTFRLYSGSIAGNSGPYAQAGVYDTTPSGKLYMYGGLILGNTGKHVGGVYSNGTFTMSGGTISHNTKGGVLSVGTFAMSGGTISYNQATKGAGVSVGKLFTMTGGSICHNTADTYGGGIHCQGGGKMLLSGGTVTGNIANGGNTGGGIFYDCEATAAPSVISGDFIVTGNSGYNGVVSNLRVNDGPIILEGDFTGSVGLVRTSSGCCVTGGAAYASQFSSDEEGYALQTRGDDLYLLKIETSGDWQYAAVMEQETTTATILKYLGDSQTPSVPDTLNSCSVTTIGEGAFEHTALTQLYLPASLTAVGGSAFAGTALETVYYGGSLEQLASVTINATGNDPLYGADVYFGSTSLGDPGTGTGGFIGTAVYSWDVRAMALTLAGAHQSEIPWVASYSAQGQMQAFQPIESGYQAPSNTGKLRLFLLDGSFSPKAATREISLR